MRRLLTLILVMAAAVLVPANRPASLAGPQLLRMGADQWPPYEFIVEDMLHGISADVTRMVLRSMDKRVSRVVEVPWKRGLQLLEWGDLDVLVSGVRTAEREQRYLYPDEPIMTAMWRVFTPMDSKIRGDADLQDVRVGVVLGYQYPEGYLDGLKRRTRVQQVSSDETNIRKLANDRLDAIIADHDNAMWILTKLGLRDEIRPVGEAIGTRHIYPLFSRETVSEELVEEFSQHLKRFKQTDAYIEILDRYSN